jgi:hypothetical protein
VATTIAIMIPTVAGKKYMSAVVAGGAVGGAVAAGASSTPIAVCAC